MENAALTSHQTVSAISASEANEIGLYSGDVISLSVEKKEALSTANSAMAMASDPKNAGGQAYGGTKKYFRDLISWSLRAGVKVCELVIGCGNP